LLREAARQLLGALVGGIEALHAELLQRDVLRRAERRDGGEEAQGKSVPAQASGRKGADCACASAVRQRAGTPG
jgi:hypothetical protein